MVLCGEFAEGHCEVAMHSQMLTGVPVILLHSVARSGSVLSAAQGPVDGDANRDWALSLG